MTDGIHDGDPVQLSEEPESMLKAIPEEAKQGNIKVDRSLEISDVEERLREWIASEDTSKQIPVSALFVCDLLIEKNAKYKDAWKKFGIYSVIIDLTQKLTRLSGMTFDPAKAEWKMSAEEMLGSIDEEGSIFDTIRDIAGYSILALALFEGANEQRLTRARSMLQRLAA